MRGLPFSSHDPLAPYRRAAARHGGGFQTLLWADAGSQRVRFEAIRRAVEEAFGGPKAWPSLRLHDAGCGRADLLDHLAAAGCEPAAYVGVEAIPELAAAAREKIRPGVEIIEADFLARPAALTGADVICISGTLNTMDRAGFYRALDLALNAARRGVVFNFLDSPARAANAYLTWHAPADVLAHVRHAAGPGAALIHRADYLDGDATVAVRLAEALPSSS